MKKIAIAAVAASVAILAVPAIAMSAGSVPYIPVPKGSAVILNTGSTNASGYRVVVQQSGAAEYISAAGRHTASLPGSVVETFFRDLAAAMPLSKLRVNPCMKSVSFGVSIFVWWRGERSPDISCPGDPHFKSLNDDVTAIAGALKLTTSPRGHEIQMLPNEPRKSMPSAAPSAPPSFLTQRVTVRAL